jgi:hypothetical protein
LQGGQDSAATTAERFGRREFAAAGRRNHVHRAQASRGYHLVVVVDTVTLWIGGAALALLVGGLVILWCLGRWPVILVNPFYRRRRRQARLFLSLPPPIVPAACQNRAETIDIKRWPDDKETGSH